MAHTDNDGFTARCNVEGPIADVSNVTKHGDSNTVYRIRSPLPSAFGGYLQVTT